MDRNVRQKNWGGPVEKLPVEVIGEILSCVGVARDVINASLTCRMWREAYRKHLHTLHFDVADDECVYSRLPTHDLEMLITKTIFQTSRLRKLSIVMHPKHKFSAGSVASWLMFARETLLELFYRVTTSPSVNVLDICGRQKIESLGLCVYTITEVDPNFQRFPNVTSLFLSDIRISAENLNKLLLAFPKLRCLELVRPQWEEKTVKLHCPTLKTLFLLDLMETEFILETCRIEYLHVKGCEFCSFKVASSKGLRHFTFSSSAAYLLEVEEANNLECVEFVTSHVSHSNFFPMKVQAPKLKTFRIWGFNLKSVSYDREDDIVFEGPWGLVDFDQMAVCSPQLSHLSIFCGVGEDCDYIFGGLSPLENVVFLEIGWDSFTGFWEWAKNVLEYCPNVRELIFHGMVPEKTDPKFLKDFAEHNSSMVEMMKDPKYQHIDVQCMYTHRSKFREYWKI